MSVYFIMFIFILLTAIHSINSVVILEPKVIYRTDEKTTRTDLLQSAWKRIDDDRNNSRCQVAISTDALGISPIYETPTCQPPSSSNIFRSVNHSLTFDQDPEYTEPNWTVLLDFEFDPTGLGEVNGLWVHYNSIDDIHPLHGETVVLFVNGPLEPHDYDKLKGIALKEPYRRKDILNLTICPMPFCGQVGSYCHNITIRIPDHLTMEETEKLPIYTKKEDKCSKLNPTVSSKELISYMITKHEDDYYHNLRRHHVKNSETVVDSKIINFIPKVEIDRTLIVILDSFGEVIIRYLCPLNYYSEAALIVYAFAEQGLENEPYLMKACHKNERTEKSSILQMSKLSLFFLLLAVIVLAILTLVTVYFVLRRTSKNRHSNVLLDVTVIEKGADLLDESSSSDTDTSGTATTSNNPNSLDDEQGDDSMQMPNQTANNSSAYDSSISRTNVTTGMDGTMEMPRVTPIKDSANETKNFSNLTSDTSDVNVSKDGFQKCAPMNRSASKVLDSSTISSGHGNSNVLNPSANNTTLNMDNCLMDFENNNLNDRYKANTSTLTHSSGISGQQHIEELPNKDSEA